ncbi:acyl-CoA dehydrogenase family protein [Spongiibacter nanhainus]|uniref:Acyl-CoA dehydrogenase family protein n=1 Tax=Spongiibacter nanhainus TaxID=2794344 RepID=A0A7T4R2V9_9GAMM|nr:acyl-CoA dehydrogenase family protein [Spongiibacter nanhainus]QQD19334.1 acyl-CoA dehydrogenase family protein [Spongiibacter nanhainus]
MADLTAFRDDVRQWLQDNCPESQRQPVVREEQVWAGRRREFPSEDAKLWFERMRDKGWTVPDWPRELGGGGLDEAHCKVLKDEMNRLGCRTPLYDLGIWMLGPAVLEFGTEEQKQEHIPKIARGEIRWCQGYSEPGAGSDLASLQTRAEDKGDHFLVNGSKIWTTNADKADWIFCLVRTDPDARKQEGISFLLIDMDDPGVTTRPIDLISGDSEFCQTFFDNVKVPKKNLLGELNKGWSVAKALLKHERKLMSEMGGAPGPNFTTVQAAQEYVGVDAQGKLRDAALRERLVRHEMTFRAIGLTHFRSFEERLAGTPDPNVPLIMKYVGTEETKRRDELQMALLGFRGLGWEGPDFNSDETLTNRAWLFSKALSIAGGTSEVQLNIIAKRALNLPQA